MWPPSMAGYHFPVQVLSVLFVDNFLHQCTKIVFCFSIVHGNKAIHKLGFMHATQQVCVWHAWVSKKTTVTNLIFPMYWQVNMLSCRSPFSYFTLSQTQTSFASICRHFLLLQSEQLNADMTNLSPNSHNSSVVSCDALTRMMSLSPCASLYAAIACINHKLFSYVRLSTLFVGIVFT